MLPFLTILRRAWHQRREFGVLLLGICLAAGFFALEPLYVKRVSEISARHIADSARQYQLNIILSNATPIQPETQQILDDGFGELITGTMRIGSATGQTTNMICTYDRDEPIATATYHINSPFHCHQFYSFSHPERVLDLTAGRWPSAQPQSEGVEIEAVIAQLVADELNIGIGDQFLIGDDRSRTVLVEIIGYVVPTTDPHDFFWTATPLALQRAATPAPGDDLRFDIGLIVLEEVFSSHVAPIAANTRYSWLNSVDRSLVSGEIFTDIEKDLSELEGILQGKTLSQSNLDVTSGLVDLSQEFNRSVNRTQGPVLLLSGAMLILMLYHLVTTTSLVLEQQVMEWSTFSSRGASTRQLIALQLVTMGILAIVGFIVGPILGRIFLVLLERFGPLSNLDKTLFTGNVGMPLDSVILSGAASFISMIVLTVPAWSTVRKSLTALRASTTRPTQKAAWIRYYVDLILVALGIAFILRLYFLTSGDLNGLINDPATFVRLLAEGAESGSGLGDPFSLAGPALLLTGAALLWLRLFPVLIRYLSLLFSRRNGLTVALAFWTVERDPGHYAQLVLVLVGTLALGTASLTLTATHEKGAWDIAMRETGANVLVTYPPDEPVSLETLNQLPGVTAVDEVIHLVTARRTNSVETTLIGIDSELLSPEIHAIDESVFGLETEERYGIPLAPSATHLSVEIKVEGENASNQITTIIDVLLEDDNGIASTVTLLPETDVVDGEFIAYRAELPKGPLGAAQRFVAFRFKSKEENELDLQHVLYLDNLAVQTDADKTIIVEDFDGELTGWETGEDVEEDVIIFSQSDGAVMVDYSVQHARFSTLYPAFTVKQSMRLFVPVVISEEFAEHMGRLSAKGKSLVVGDRGTINLDLAAMNFQLPFEVVGVIREFATVNHDERFIIADAETLRYRLNMVRVRDEDFFSYNMAWIALDTREPVSTFDTELMTIPNVRDVTIAQTRYEEIQRDPLMNAVTGMLFAGFWVSLGLGILDFAFYLAMTAKRRSTTFAILRAMGWSVRHLWGLLVVEQVSLVIPALFIGVLLGNVLAYLLLPFLSIVGSESLTFPLFDIGALLLVFIGVFALLLTLMAFALQRLEISQVIREQE